MSINRRFFLKSIGSVGITTATTPLSLLSNEKKEMQFQFMSKPYLQNFNKETITLIATFNKKCIAWLEVLNNDNTLKETIYQTEDGMRNANTDLFKFKVSHGNNNFRYRIAAKEILKFDPYKIEYGETIHSISQNTQLPISTSDSVHLLIFNDIHENISTYSDLYEKSTLPKKDLIILNGDVFHHVNSKSDIVNKLIKPISEVFASKTPFIMVRGNHETRGSYARDLKKHFDYPENKFHQAFLIGNIYIIILDGGEDKPDNHEVYAARVDYDSYRLEQKKWLEKKLNSKERKKAKHTIIINHIPWHHSDEWHGTLHNKFCFHNLVHSNKVDAVISGHTHQYGFYKPNNEHNYYVIIGGGPQIGNRTFVEVSTIGNTLSISLRKDDGSLINRLYKT